MMAGTITISTPAGEFSGPIEVRNQAPNKVRTLINLDLSAVGVGKITIDQRFDGITGYAIDTLQGNRDITGDQLEGMRNGFFPTPLLNYKQNGIGIELTGKEKVGDRDAFVLVLKPKTGPSLKSSIDATTFMMFRQVVTARYSAGRHARADDGFLRRARGGRRQVSHKLVSSSSVQNFTVTISKVEHNAAMDQTLFVKPAN